MDTKDIHILVVEDSPAQAAKLRYVLERRGHRVSVASSGREAIASMALRVFDKMHQVGHAIDDGRKGLGMGLHIAKALVCGQNGRIWAESVAPRGNTFFFTLPLSSRSGTPATHAREKQGREKTS